MADRPTLPAEDREERGSRATRRLRRSGFIPGIVYGVGKDVVAFKVTPRDLRLALQDASAVIDLKMGSSRALPVIVKETQQHPVRGDVQHIDLLQVDLTETIQSTVLVELEGVDEAPGVVQGGVLEQVTRELNIEALPGDIPENIVVDVSGMEINGTMHLSEIQPPEGVTFLDDAEETIVATIGAPTGLEETDAVETETELVGEESADEGDADSDDATEDASS